MMIFLLLDILNETFFFPNGVGECPISILPFCKVWKQLFLLYEFGATDFYILDQRCKGNLGM